MIKLSTKRNNWTDNPCYYVSVKNDSQTGILAGPFKTHQDAIDMVEQCRAYADKLDSMAHFYAFGTCKLDNGYREGLFNGNLKL